MKAVVVTDPGGPEALEVLDRPQPEPGPGQLRVDVRAAGVNFIDIYERSGRYPMPTPFVAGSEGAGVVSVVGEGVAVVYDGVGRATFDASLDSLRRRGTMVLFGAASGPVPPFDPQALNAKGSLFLTRPSLGHYVATREELLWRAGEVLDWVGSGQMMVHVGERYPLSDARRAHEDLAARRTTGKLLLIP